MKKTVASAALSVLLSIILATVAFAAPAANNDGVPFKGTWQAQEVVIDNGPPTALHGIGSGNATHLGRYTVDYYPVVNPDFSATTSAIFVASNGDTLTTVGTGQGVPAGGPGEFDLVEEHTITGGTGRFAGATGSFTVYRHINVITLVTFGTFDGRIVLPKGH